MKLPGLITVSPDQTDLLKETADMMGESFMEENWFITWLSALDAINTPYERKLELIRAVFLDDLSVHAPYQGVYVLEDKAAACGGYLYSDLQGHTHSELDTKAGTTLLSIATQEELDLLEQQDAKMEAISDFDWARVHAKENDHIYFFAWAVDKNARRTHALTRLVTPFFEKADSEGLNCYLECYADHLQAMYEHLGFEVIDVLSDPQFEVTERRMVRYPRH